MSSTTRRSQLRALLAHLAASCWLGLNRTPERSDGLDILHWFGANRATTVGALTTARPSQIEWAATAMPARRSPFTYAATPLRLILAKSRARFTTCTRCGPWVLREREHAGEWPASSPMPAARRLLDARAPATSAADDPPPQVLVNCRSSSGGICSRGSTSPRSTPCCSCGQPRAASCFLQQLRPGPAPCPGKSCYGARFHRQAHRRFRHDLRLPRPARRQRDQLRQQIEAASLPSPRLQPPARSRPPGAGAFNLRESLPSRRPSLPGRDASLGPASRRRWLEGLAWSPGSFMWRGVGRCCSGSFGWGQGHSGDPTADEEAVGAGIAAACFISTTQRCAAGGSSSQRGRWRQIRRASILLPRPVADAAGPSSGAWPQPCALAERWCAFWGAAHSRRAGWSFSRCCWSAPTSWWRRSLAASGRWEPAPPLP